MDSNAQEKPDSIFFNLYTDSLKKGTYNYINVDGKYPNGRYLPMTARELDFFCSYGSFDGNSLFIDSACKEDKITVKIVLKKDTSVSREKVIYIKKHDEVPRLKTMKEVMGKNKQ
jgi:hypothetical protein